MSKIKFRKDEVISYMEEKILDGTATDEESELYENYMWYGKLDTYDRAFKNLIREMRDIYNNGY